MIGLYLRNTGAALGPLSFGGVPVGKSRTLACEVRATGSDFVAPGAPITLEAYATDDHASWFTFSLSDSSAAYSAAVTSYAGLLPSAPILVWVRLTVPADAEQFADAPDGRIRFITPDPNATLPVPTGVTAALSGEDEDDILVTWDAMTADGFAIQRTDGTGWVTLVTLSDGTLTSCLDETAETGPYAYEVAAIFGGFTGPWSDPAVYGSAGSGPIDTTPPSKVIGVVATPSTGQIALVWTAATDNVAVADYQVQYRPTGQLGWIDWTLVDVAHATITGLASISFDFRIRAIDTAGNNGDWSDIVTSAILDVTAPTQVSGIIAVASATQIALAWPPSTDDVAVAGYHVQYRITAGAGSWTSAADVTAPNALLTGLSNGATYDVQVQSFDAAGNTAAWSATTTVTLIDTQAPTQPTSLTAAVGSGQIGLAWTASTDNVGVDHYAIEHRKTGDTLWIDWPTNATTNSATITGLVNGQSYDFQVKAYDAAGNKSAWSSVATGTPGDVTPPAAPTGLTVDAGGGQLTLHGFTATDDVGVVSYDLLWRTSSTAPTSGTTPSQTGVLAGASVVATGLLWGTTYRNYARAIDTTGNVGPWCAAVLATTNTDTTAPSATQIAGEGFNASALVQAFATDNSGVIDHYQLQRLTRPGATFWLDFLGSSLPPQLVMKNGTCVVSGGILHIASALYWGSHSQVVTDCEVYGVITNATYPSLIARSSNNGANVRGDNCYFMYVGSDGLYLCQNVAGAPTTLQMVDLTPSSLIGKEIALRCAGTTISVAVNGVITLSATDATYASGVCGFGGGNWDSWGFGDLPAYATVGTIPSSGDLLIAGLLNDYGEYFRARAYDEAGNVGGWGYSLPTTPVAGAAG